MNGELLVDDLIPLYRQIGDRIREAIRIREFKPNEKIPGEPELMDFFNVSRITIRKAMMELENDGLLVKKQGKGTFVSPVILASTPTSIDGWTQNLTRLGYKPGKKLLFKEMTGDIDIRIRERLALGPNEQALHIKRTFLADGEPVSMEDNYFHPKFRFIYDMDLNKISTYAMIKEKTGVVPYKSDKVIGIDFADRDTALILGVKKGHPLLLSREMVYEQNGDPIHFAIIRGLAEKINIHMISRATMGETVSEFRLL